MTPSRPDPRPDLTPFLTAEELTTARTYAGCLERELRSQLDKRLNRLRALFGDRPAKAAGARKWLLALPPERLALFADLTTFEAAALALPAPGDQPDWQASLALADAYPAGIPDACAKMYQYLVDLRIRATERRTEGWPAHSAASLGSADGGHRPGRPGRRTVRREATRIGS